LAHFKTILELFKKQNGWILARLIDVRMALITVIWR